MIFFPANTKEDICVKKLFVGGIYPAFMVLK